jgi:hypothetical protein
MSFLNDWGEDLMSLGNDIRSCRTFGDIRKHLETIKVAISEIEVELDILQADQKKRKKEVEKPL